jgi:hypothetical protein
MATNRDPISRAAEEERRRLAEIQAQRAATAAQEAAEAKRAQDEERERENRKREEFDQLAPKFHRDKAEPLLKSLAAALNWPTTGEPGTERRTIAAAQPLGFCYVSKVEFTLPAAKVFSSHGLLKKARTVVEIQTSPNRAFVRTPDMIMNALTCGAIPLPKYENDIHVQIVAFPNEDDVRRAEHGQWYTYIGHTEYGLYFIEKRESTLYELDPPTRQTTIDVWIQEQVEALTRKLVQRFG